MSDTLLAMNIFLFQPVTEIQVFNLADNKICFLTFFLLANLFTFEFVLTIPMFYGADILGFRRMVYILKNDIFEYPMKVSISTPFIYRACRHPMQGAFIGMFIFSSPVYSLGRFVFVSLMLVGIFIGIAQEEHYLNKSSMYLKYKRYVPNRFIPDISNAMDPEVITAINDDKSK